MDNKTDLIDLLQQESVNLTSPAEIEILAPETTYTLDPRIVQHKSYYDLTIRARISVEDGFTLHVNGRRYSLDSVKLAER